MRRVVLHRRAVKAIRGLPGDRQIQIVRAIEKIANLANPLDDPNVKALQGEFAGWFRIRTGIYRSICQLRQEQSDEVLYVDFVGSRGDAY